MQRPNTGHYGRTREPLRLVCVLEEYLTWAEKANPERPTPNIVTCAPEVIYNVTNASDGIISDDQPDRIPQAKPIIIRMLTLDRPT